MLKLEANHNSTQTGAELPLIYFNSSFNFYPLLELQEARFQDFLLALSHPSTQPHSHISSRPHGTEPE